MKHALTILALLLATGCGAHVKPIDLHDPLVPLESRRLLADAQDAIAIARVDDEKARQNLHMTRNWRDELLEDRRWGKVSDSALEKLEQFADARVKLAELELDKADARVDLAKSKYKLVTAETAVRHDIAVYDLEPLRDDTDGIRKEIADITGKIADQRVALEKITRSWWATYAKIMHSSAATPAMYVNFSAHDEEE